MSRCYTIAREFKNAQECLDCAEGDLLEMNGGDITDSIMLDHCLANVEF